MKISTNSDIAISNIKLEILPPSFKNDTFKQNMAFFKSSQASIYNAVFNHVCEKYKLCANPDGSPNILDVNEKKPVYTTFTLADTFSQIRKRIEGLGCKATIPSGYLRGGPEQWKKNNPIQRNMQNKLYDAGMFSALGLTPDDLSPLESHKTDFFPLLRIYGIGLGYHILEALKLKNINYLTIYEPHLDLFYTSLFTISWQVIFNYFSVPTKDFNLVVGASPDEAVSSNTAFFRQRLSPLTSYFYRLVHINTKEITDVIKKEDQADPVARSQSDEGWYEDQRIGLYRSAINIRKRNKFYNGKTVTQFSRAFIVGSGPSLNEALDIIEKYKDKAIIIACGSAITPLYIAGIRPDYEIVQERNWQQLSLESSIDQDFLGKVNLFKLNVASGLIDHHFNDVMVFQKYRDPGSSLLGDQYPYTTGVNPTVTNTGVAICSALGIQEVYFFGVDYGAPEDAEKLHAANTRYDDASLDDRVATGTHDTIPGNFGSVIRTNHLFLYSLNVTKVKIAEAPNVKWYNVGDGAYISGTTPLTIEEVRNSFSKNINKPGLKSEIANCFDSEYRSEDVFAHLKTVQVQQIEEYLGVLEEFCKPHPESREEIIHSLTFLYNAVGTGKDTQHFLPSSLLSYGFNHFISSVYMQICLALNDAEAAAFYSEAQKVLLEYISDIRKDFAVILDLIEQEEEKDYIVASEA